MCIETVLSRVFHQQSQFIQDFKKYPTVMEQKFITATMKVNHCTLAEPTALQLIQQLMVRQHNNSSSTVGQIGERTNGL
jgi:hypothetical protein